MIYQLSVETANQIAAGEVVERPASIVKELVENSLDADALSIQVLLENGGLKRISIKDDGVGISKKDLPLAITPHATSKIQTLSDLDHIKTFGFRGEALSSIASVSEFGVRSIQAGAVHGWEWSSGEIKPAAIQQGTEINVKNLFYNVPARRKFMRTEATELKRCLSVIHRIALANPEISMMVEHNGKRVFQCNSGEGKQTRVKRIGQILGREFEESLIEIDIQQSSFHLTGFVARATFSRAQSDMLFWYVNGRPVKDGLLNAAARRAYQDQMYQSRQPAFVLNLSLPSDQVDVNVHPAKSEVRFRNTQVFHFIQQAINHVITKPIKEQGNQEYPPKLSRTIAAEPERSATSPLARSNGRMLEEPSKPKAFFSDYAKFIGSVKHNGVGLDTKDLASPTSTPECSLGDALAFIHGVYILSQTTKGLCIIDAHGAHERILYERLKRLQETNNLSAQKLLVPVSLRLSLTDMVTLKQYISHFTDLKFDIDVVGDQSAIVRQIPSLLMEADIALLIKDTLSDLQVDKGSKRVIRSIHDLFSTVACHSAVRANRNLNVYEMNALLRQLESVESGGVCNHGRPITQHIALSEMDKWFKRGQ